MSTKQLRRYLRENDVGVKQEWKKSVAKESDCLEESESDDGAEVFTTNRYEFLDELGEGSDEESGGVVKEIKEKKQEKKVIRKRWKGKKEIQRVNKNSGGINVLCADCLQQMSLSEQHRRVTFEKDLFKIDSRMLNVENELRSILGRRNAEMTRRSRKVFGKIVKKKPSWPEVGNIGLSMTLDRTEGNIFWFKFSHHSGYRELQQNYWIASETLDHSFISNILAQCPYHLDSLLVMAELLRQQEDYQLSRDLIERGLFCCESIFASRFQLSNYEHRIDYNDFENRAFYLLLHRHLRNLVDRHCFRTAFHVAKLIYRLDPDSDPLAIMLTIDMVALKAREYNYLIVLYNTLKAPKNLDKLPNFSYSVALAYFFLFRESGKAEDKKNADLQIASAIRHFPTVLLKILDAINVQPDPAVENNKFMNAMAHERESEGIKLLTSIYVKLISSLWSEDLAVLTWLEEVTAATVSSFKYYKDELTEWEEIRKACYVGIPRNIERHAYLWEITRSDKWVLTDPAPPYDGRTTYIRIANITRTNSFLSGLLQSMWPEYEQGQNFNESIGDVLNALRGIFVLQRANTDEQLGRNQDDEVNNEEGTEVELEHHTADLDNADDDGDAS